MDKDLVYNNIFELINEGFFFEKYKELTNDVNEELTEDNTKYLENISANIFNAILIGCQLFDEKDKITKFVDMFALYLNSDLLENFLPEFDISEQEALERLKHGFGIHFTTINIASEIQKSGVLSGFGKNSMFTEEENRIINQASIEQRKNNPEAEMNLNYLFTGFGAGVSSYGSMTTGYWMYHTPESLSFLFGNISKRNKEKSMKFVLNNISSLSEDNKKITFDTLYNIYDRLIGESQEVCCLLIDRDSFEYEKNIYYNSSIPTVVEKRPYSHGFNSLMDNDMKISNNIEVNNLKFISIPTIRELERQKKEMLIK